MDAPSPESLQSSGDGEDLPPLGVGEQDEGHAPLESRAYQLEILEYSMKSNIIAAMDTGSGKTWIAKLRIEAELARSPTKIVWFTAPSVVLAEQQHIYLSLHLAQYSNRLITGSDNIELWSTQDVWDAALLNVKLVVSTPQILLEGLTHGFIRIQQMSLLVVDEAHNCVAQAPSNRIMQHFYHPLRRATSAPELPHILGMTASPITTKLVGMEMLERNINAVCKTPTQQLEGYRRYVHMPNFVTLSYTPRDSLRLLPIELMLRIPATVDMSEDPWIKELLQDPRPGSMYKVKNALEKKSTYSMDQLKKLHGNIDHLCGQVGPWATNVYLREILLKLQSKVQSNDWLTSLSDEEHRYLNNLLGEIRELSCKAYEEGDIIHQLSPKADRLVNFLMAEYRRDVSCVIFVERRSTAFALTRLLQSHPSIHYTVASFVGSSQSSKTDNDLIDLADVSTQKLELEEFRKGTRSSIVVATSVMEEGIDVQATNLVIRFDDSKTVRSYIQSRGRARKIASKFVVMCSTQDSTSKYHDWTTLEAAMKALYTSEMREIEARLKLETEDEEGGQEYNISSTGAKLTFENARSHLEHFCQRLPKVQYEPNPRPNFICQGAHRINMSAKVILPSSLPHEVKEVCGTSTWRTEKAAKRDAAFVAVRKLHQLSLINDHLLPPPLPQGVTLPCESRASFADIQSQINVWLPIVAETHDDMLLHVHRLHFKETHATLSSLLLVLPNKLDGSLSVPLYYTRSQQLKATVVYTGTRTMDAVSRALAQGITLYLMRTALVAQIHNPESWNNGLPFFLLPDIAEAELCDWFNFTQMTMPLVEFLENPPSSLTGRVALRYTSSSGLYLSDLTRSDILYKNSLFALPEYIPAILAKRLPRRLDYLTESNAPPSMDSESVELAIGECVVCQICPSLARAMQFVPSIIHVADFALVAAACCKELLHDISDIQLVAEALTSPLAYKDKNYEVLEFFGDTLLKLYACLQVFADSRNANLPEGYLTIEAEKLVNNARLQRAALEIGFDRFMIHEPWIKQWKPEASKPQEDAMRLSRTSSTKTVADHVEALIAVAFLDDSGTGGEDAKAISFLNRLLPETEWALPTANVAGISNRPLPTELPSFEALSVVESILGYAFQQRHLLAEALNHSSINQYVPTYGRLEFLGDAVLQRIINEAVYRAPPRYSQRAMHLRQAACVSHSYLAFLCFEASHEVDRCTVNTDLATRKATTEKSTETKYLWQFMTHSNMDIAPAQQRSLHQYLERRDQIQEQLAHSKTYPWALLASIAAPKFFSDIIESVLAAVFIDSGADLDACTTVLAKLGMTKLLQRLIDEPDLILEQPKTLLWQARAKAGLPALKAVSRSRREAGGQRYNCQLMLDSVVYAEVDDAWCEEEAVLRACEIGLDMFRSELGASEMPEVEEGASQLIIEDESKKRKREDSSRSLLNEMVGDD